MGQESCLTAATGRSWLHTLTLSNLYRRLVVCCGSTHSLLDLAGHSQESLLNIGCVLSRRLEEWNAKAVSEFLCNCVLHNLLVPQYPRSATSLSCHPTRLF